MEKREKGSDDAQWEHNLMRWTELIVSLWQILVYLVMFCPLAGLISPPLDGPADRVRQQETVHISFLTCRDHFDQTLVSLTQQQCSLFVRVCSKHFPCHAWCSRSEYFVVMSGGSLRAQSVYPGALSMPRQQRFILQKGFTLYKKTWSTTSLN